ncbi:MAG: hypothetical protein KF819_10675 [Labilithrix sp.]|nr:hypothetical protein [Labilithrix sp.]
MKLPTMLVAAIALLVFACNASEKPPLVPTSPSTRPTCDAIDRACDPHEDEGGLAKECHDLAEAAATDEAACVQRKAECLAACPPKS